jgi:hypothetical protein
VDQQPADDDAEEPVTGGATRYEQPAAVEG